MQNIIQAHQKLEFKNGDYSVLTAITGANAPYYQKGSSADHLIIERTGKAIIGITDAYYNTSNNSQDQEAWVSSSWNNIDLIDYSGAHGLNTTHVQNDGRVLIKTAPAGHTIAGARGHGYSVWAPVPQGVTFTSVNDLYDYLSTYSPGRSPVTTQEWEMADDLGDSNPNSLKQGGQLPDNSTAIRTVCSFSVAANKNVTVSVYPEVSGRKQTVLLYLGKQLLGQKTGISSTTAPLSGSFTLPQDMFVTLKIQNANNTTPGQKVWVNISYTAPTSINTRTAARSGESNANENTDLENPVSQSQIIVYPNPTNGVVTLTGAGINYSESYEIMLKGIDGRTIAQVNGNIKEDEKSLNHILKSQPAGLYILSITGNHISEQVKVIKQ